MITIVIAEDHRLVRDGLRRILAEAPDFSVVAEASTAAEAHAALERHKPDVMLLDISMPDRSGIDFLLENKPLLKKTKVLMLTMHPERLFAIRALQSGASGYMTKESAGDDLVGAVRKIHKGGHYVSDAVADAMASTLAKRPTDREGIELLSGRELDVLRHIAGGLKPSDIGRKLSLSTSSVQTYRSRILAKLGLHTTSDLIRYALEKKIVE